MHTSAQDEVRERLLELGRTNPERLIAQYRQVAHMKPDETLPFDLTEMIDAIVTDEVPIYRRPDQRWR